MAALRYQRSSSANSRAIRGAKKKLAWTLAQRAVTRATTTRLGLRGKTASSRKIQLSTWGRARPWMLAQGAVARAAATRLRLRGKTARSRKIQLRTWGPASQWMLQVERSRGA